MESLVPKQPPLAPSGVVLTSFLGLAAVALGLDFPLVSLSALGLAFPLVSLSAFGLVFPLVSFSALGLVFPLVSLSALGLVLLSVISLSALGLVLPFLGLSISWSLDAGLDLPLDCSEETQFPSA